MTDGVARKVEAEAFSVATLAFTLYGDVVATELSSLLQRVARGCGADTRGKEKAHHATASLARGSSAPPRSLALRLERLGERARVLVSLGRVEEPLAQAQA